MTDKQKIKSLERELKRAKLDVCELCQRLGEDICTCGGECDYKESEDGE
jgi:hypothetical protein